MAFEPPIQNLDRIDVVGKRNDGGVDLVIVASGPLRTTLHVTATYARVSARMLREDAKFLRNYGAQSEALRGHLDDESAN